MQQLEKDRTIHEVLEHLDRRFGPSSLSVVDHWDADLMSIGVHRPDAPRPLVYICTHKRPAGHLIFGRLPATELAGIDQGLELFLGLSAAP